MKNFSRVLRIALQFRWTVAGTFGFSLLVAILWGGNIGALYPVIQVAFQGSSLQTWIDEEVDKSRDSIANYEETIDKTQKQLEHAKPEDVPVLEHRLRDTEFDLMAEQKVLATQERVQPWIPR